MAECVRIQKLNTSNNNKSYEFDFNQLNYTLIEFECRNSSLTIHWIVSIYRLKKLDLSGNKTLCTGNDFATLCNLDLFGKLQDTLIELILEKCNLNYQFLTAILECKVLEKLDLGENLTLNTENKAVDFKNLKETLTVLIMSKCDLKTNFLSAVSNCNKIKTLDLSSNYHICDNISSDFTFKKLENTLSDLNFNFCKATFAILNAINECKRLKKLAIHWNENLSIGMPDTFEFKKILESHSSI